MSDERMSVMSVIPDTGFVPTMAMALAATVVKRNEMTKTISSAVIDCTHPSSSPKWKKMKSVSSVATRIVRIRFIDRSCCVRSDVSPDFLPPPNSETARAYGLADDLRLADDADDAGHGDAADADRLADVGEEVLGREEARWIGEDLLARDAQQRASAAGSIASASEPTTGTMTNHTRHDPAVMISAYFSPMM